jgi:hypothetical protein
MPRAKPRRKREPSAPRYQGHHARGPRDGRGPLGEPGGQARDVQPRSREQVLQPGRTQAALAGVAQTAGGDRLRDDALDPGPRGVAGGARGRRLARPRRPQCLSWPITTSG